MKYWDAHTGHFHTALWLDALFENCYAPVILEHLLIVFWLLVHQCVLTHNNIQIYIFFCTYIYEYAVMHTYFNRYTLDMFIYTRTYIYITMNKDIFIYVHTYVYTNIHKYTYISIYIHEDI